MEMQPLTRSQPEPLSSPWRRELPISATVLVLALLSLPAPRGVLEAAPPRLGAEAAALPEPLKRPVKYFGDVHPILADHCLSCHGADKQNGGLRLDSLEAALRGGSSFGPAILPGNSAESPFIQFIAHLEPDMEMPPDEEPLAEAQIALLRAWIDQGAPWPKPAGGGEAGTASLGDQDLFFRQASTHWAYQPVPKFEVSDTEGTEGEERKIDALIRAQLAENGLTPSPAADPRTLIRRLHFDLVGLPPTPEEVDAFVRECGEESAENSPGGVPASVWEALVDRLLESPRFGERWGRYWLDIARYADTRDFQAQADLRYPFAWTYRDYVIEAFNTDKPYHRFLLEQLAADQLELKEGHPAMAALGFLTVGPRFRNNAPELINDRIDVTTRGLMGTTVACARCHDHKYDPIPTADFYALYGVFSSTEDLTELPEVRTPHSRINPRQREDYEKQIVAARADITAYLEKLRDDAVADILAKPELYFDGLVQMEITKTADVRKLITGKKMVETALTPLSRRWNDLRREVQWQADPVIGPLARVAVASPEQKPRILEGMIQSGRVPGSRIEIHPEVLKVLRSENPKEEPELVNLYGSLLARAIEKQEDELSAVLTAFRSEGALLDFSLDDVERAHRLLGSGRAALNRLYTGVSEIEATHPGSPPRAMAVADKAKPVEPVIFIRGETNRRGDAVERRFLEVLDPEKTPFPADSSGRLELARKIASRDNPLTGRVWANHVWRHLLGHALVATPGDFGLQADEPTHPELLDWLAAALMDRGWSTKQLIRDIVLSETYRQSSADRPEYAEKDSENRLLWRANRRRMDFEAMRDSILAASGEVDFTMGGRAESLSSEPFSKRRTIYGYVDRVNLDPLFTTFDFPSPDTANTGRSETLVPQQALFALNDDFIIAQARAMVKDVQSDAASPADTVERLYRRVFLRSPAPEETALAEFFLREAAQERGTAMQGSWRYGYGSSDPEVPASERFKRLPYFDSETKRYQAGRTFPHPELGHMNLSAVGGHPGRSREMASIRRWVAPYDAEIAVTGEISVIRPGNGDGVRAQIISARAGVLGEWIAETEPASTGVEKHTVRRGEILDFIVDCRENGNSDAYRWNPTIRLLVEAEMAPTDVQTVWEAQADFSPPPPPPLQPLEQLAHALLMTNEFLFVD